MDNKLASSFMAMCGFFSPLVTSGQKKRFNGLDLISRVKNRPLAAAFQYEVQGDIKEKEERQNSNVQINILVHSQKDRTRLKTMKTTTMDLPLFSVKK